VRKRGLRIDRSRIYLGPTIFLFEISPHEVPTSPAIIPEMTITDQTARTAPEAEAGRGAGQPEAAAGRPSTGRFPSILFPRSEDAEGTPTEEPEFFRDLNLDQIVAALTKGREAYNLKPYFYAPLRNLDQVAYRHEIMRDLEKEALFASLKSFSERMLAMRELFTTEKYCSYQYQKERILLGAAQAYCEGAANLRRELDAIGVQSRGLRAMRDYLAAYVESSFFQALAQKVRTVREGLDAIRYCVLIDEANVTVRNFEEEPDYSAEVEDTFAIFKQGAAKDYRVEVPETAEMNHIEAMVLDYVAKLNPAAFAALDEFYAKYPDFADRGIVEFDRGLQFYISYAEFMTGFKSAGLHFCYPQVSDSSKEVLSRNGFDLSLASKLIATNTSPVSNDYHLTGAERMMVITGPNQGGKTTFARAFGQLHYLAGLGYPVPGSEARVFLADRYFTHFDSEEDIKNLAGKLKDDLTRMHRILEQATPKSLVVMNEIFASTSLKDAIFLAKKILTRFAEIDVLGVCVTFLDELSSLNEKTVSMVAAIVPENPSQRTFRIDRRPANGLSYAVALAEKYHLTYEQLKKRINP
jgi:DNA mismatch repair protein MutS